MPMPDNVKKYADKYWDIYQVGTLPPSGQLGMNQINGEFGRGNNLGAYRGTQWWTDTYGQTGTFSQTNLGYNQFYGKRGSSPAPPYLFNAVLTTARKIEKQPIFLRTTTYIGYNALDERPYGRFTNPYFTDGTLILKVFQVSIARGGSNPSTSYQMVVRKADPPDVWNFIECVGVFRYSRTQFTRVNDGGYNMRLGGFSIDPFLDYTIIFT